MPPKYTNYDIYGNKTNNGWAHGINDALTLLETMWVHKCMNDEAYYGGQTTALIAEWTDGFLSQQRVSELITPKKSLLDKYGNCSSYLEITAHKYGYKFILPKRRGYIIDVYDKRFPWDVPNEVLYFTDKYIIEGQYE